MVCNGWIWPTQRQSIDLFLECYFLSLLYHHSDLCKAKQNDVRTEQIMQIAFNIRAWLNHLVMGIRGIVLRSSTPCRCRRMIARWRVWESFVRFCSIFDQSWFHFKNLWHLPQDRFTRQFNACVFETICDCIFCCVYLLNFCFVCA